MESKAYNFHRKRRKRRKSRNHTRFPSTSMQESVLTTNSTLAQELITEILLRLPVKPLLRFRCVSKSWLALISSPQFVKTHLSLSTSDNKDYTHHMLTLNYGRSVSKSIDYNFKDCIVSSLLNVPVTKVFDLDYSIDLWSKKLHEHSIVGSVHGLICVKLKSDDLFLWNPSIRKYKKLPHCSPTWHHWWLSIHGFGYDEFNDDYKVAVFFYRNGRPDQVEVKIYSLKSDSWENVDGYPSGRLLPVSGKFVNGKLHWPALTPPDIFEDYNIISFDLADGRWEKVEQPCYGEGGLTPCLGVLGTNLCIFYDDGISYRDVWVMKEYGIKESWTKMLAFKYSSSNIMCVPPSFMSNKGEILVYFGSNILIYNSKDGSLRYSKVINFDVCRGAELYVDSLVCPLST